MDKPARIQISLAAFFAFTAVISGAFGAHALEEFLIEREMTDTWETAVFYHLIHAAALLAIGVWNAAKPADAPGGWTTFFLAGGILLFSGSIYGLCLGAPAAILGPVTPLGGLCFLIGWITVFLAAWRKPADKRPPGRPFATEHPSPRNT